MNKLRKQLNDTPFEGVEVFHTVVSPSLLASHPIRWNV